MQLGIRKSQLIVVNINQQKMSAWDTLCLSTRSARFLDRSVPPTRGAPWSYADVCSPVATNHCLAEEDVHLHP